MVGLGTIQIAFVVAVDAQPVHLPSPRHFVLAHNGNVVLGLAGNDTGVAADAGVHVDRHPPGVAFVLVRRVKRSLRFLRIA